MSTLTRPVAAILATLLVALALGAATADAATYKNKTTGETIKGTLTTQRINGQTIFKYDDGRTRYVNPDDWTMIDAGPAPVTPTWPSPPPP